MASIGGRVCAGQYRQRSDWVVTLTLVPYLPKTHLCKWLLYLTLIPGSCHHLGRPFLWLNVSESFYSSGSHGQLELLLTVINDAYFRPLSRD